MAADGDLKMPKTLHDRYVEALQLRGCVITPQQPSRKYTRLTRPARDGTFYFVGRSGAVRYGKTVTGSFAASEEWKARLFAAAMRGTN